MTASRFLSLSADRRALAFGQTAAALAASPVMIEKDFWVCWLLDLLFTDEALAPHLVFKGGTSLSKVYGVIDRFSEDIDLSLAPLFVGIEEQAVSSPSSRTQRNAALLRMQAACSACTKSVVMPRLEQAIVRWLGTPSIGAWLTYEDDPSSRSPVVNFHYPTSQPTGFDYLRRAVKLELGSLTDQRPTGRHPIRPWVADTFPTAFDDWNCVVTALELSRTFWEKATILHAEHHRPHDQPMPDRYARHYADVARLLMRPDAINMMDDAVLCSRVVEWKSRMFTRQWARYDIARHGSFKLMPHESRIGALSRDYNAMRPMFLSQPPSFERVLDRLATAENYLNRAEATTASISPPPPSTL